MKLNIGCGVNKIDGFLNVDKCEVYQPDMVMDAEKTPWPFRDNEVEQALFNHSLEHMGADAGVFLSIVKELYRVCMPDALVQINVPHPRHDNFINDPTHVRIITPQLLLLFSRAENLHWREIGSPNTQLALSLGVDFKIVNVSVALDDKYRRLVDEGYYDSSEIEELSKQYNNVVKSYGITLRVVK